MEKMTRRVAHVLRKFDVAEWGGTETYVAELTRRLSARGWAPEVHAPAGPAGGAGALTVPLRRFHAFNPFVGSAEKRRALWQSSGNLVSLHEAWRLYRDRGLPLVHLHTQGRIGGAVRSAMRLRGRPYVISVHGPLLAESGLVAEDTARRTAGLWDLGKPFGALFGARRVLDDAARVLCFNDDEHAALSARLGDRAVRMDHGVDRVRLASGDAARARARWPVLGAAPVVALVGRLSVQKNQTLAVQAFAAGAPADHCLVLAGAATDAGAREAIVEEARRLGVAERVHLLGNLDSQQEIPDLFACSTLVLVPSLHEAFGLAVLEAWAAHRPVLFSRRAGLADLARHAPDAAVDGAQAQAWASALGSLLRAPERLRAMGEAGAALVRDRFDWDSVVTRVCGVYDAVLADVQDAALAG